MTLLKIMMKKICLNLAVLLIGITFNASATEVTKIAILDFELNYITSLPNVPEEIIRTASFKP